LDVARSLFTMLPAAVLWGASFPLAVAAAARANERDRHDTGRTVGRVYAANTLGAIAGSLLSGLVFVPLMGTHNAERVLIIVSGISAAVALVPPFRSSAAGTSFAFGLLVLCALLAAANIGAVPAGLVAWGRLLARQGEPNALYIGEGINASVAVTEEANG